MIKNFLEYILDKSVICWFILPAAIYNIVTSYFTMTHQFKILKTVINENDSFATALGTLGFKPGKFNSLVAIFETDLDMTDDEIYSTANQQIILMVKNFVTDEMLLGIVKIEFVKLRNRNIQIDIQPADKNLFKLDVANLIYSILIHSIAIIAFFIIL